MITPTGVETDSSEKIQWSTVRVLNMWTTSRMPPSDTGNCQPALEFKIPTLQKKEVEEQVAVQPLDPG